MVITYTFGINGLNDSKLSYRLQQNGVFRALNIPPDYSWRLIREWYKL
jgi:hypothetical protein